jgi:hypothetical protein
MVQNSGSLSDERTATLPSRVERDLRELTLPGDHELALPGELVDATQAFTRAARSQRTRLAYSRAWAGFEAWCRKNGRRALPATPDTVVGWMAALATGNGVPNALARSRRYWHAFSLESPCFARSISCRSSWPSVSPTAASRAS